MLQDNLSGLSGDRAEQMAKNIWLAGLGAYSKTYEELSDRYDNVQERYEEINAEGQKMFDKLVERGKSMQGDFEEVVSQRRSSLEERVEEFRERFGGGLSAFVDIPSRLRDAAEKIDELSEKLKKKD
ncbi:MAG: phasin family protein [Pseudomonadota bacterium]